MTVTQKRAANEKKFVRWEELQHDGRRYSYTVKGRFGWKARYVKEVDSLERTTRFYQEIYDDHDQLVEIHEKYPIDKGHTKL